MDERKDILSQIAKDQYREKIVKMIDEVEDMDYLEFIYNMMMSFRKKWGI